jgi:hypothetical protein
MTIINHLVLTIYQSQTELALDPSNYLMKALHYIETNSLTKRTPSSDIVNHRSHRIQKRTFQTEDYQTCKIIVITHK